MRAEKCRLNLTIFLRVPQSRARYAETGLVYFFSQLFNQVGIWENISVRGDPPRTHSSLKMQPQTAFGPVFAKQNVIGGRVGEKERRDRETWLFRKIPAVKKDH